MTRCCGIIESAKQHHLAARLPAVNKGHSSCYCYAVTQLLSSPRWLFSGPGGCWLVSQVSLCCAWYTRRWCHIQQSRQFCSKTYLLDTVLYFLSILFPKKVTSELEGRSITFSGQPIILGLSNAKIATIVCTTIGVWHLLSCPLWPPGIQADCSQLC